MTVADQTIGAFLAEVATGDVPPGGGAAAAVCGAAGAALGEMVCSLTVGADDPDDDEAELTRLRDEFAERRVRMLELADEDSAAVEELMAAYRTPEGDGRNEAIQSATKRATEVPLELAEESHDVLERLTVATERGTPDATADGGIGAFLAHSALQASVFTVRVNLEALDDDAFVTETDDRIAELTREGDEAFSQVSANLDDAF